MNIFLQVVLIFHEKGNKATKITQKRALHRTIYWKYLLSIFITISNLIIFSFHLLALSLITSCTFAYQLYRLLTFHQMIYFNWINVFDYTYLFKDTTHRDVSYLFVYYKTWLCKNLCVFFHAIKNIIIINEIMRVCVVVLLIREPLYFEISYKIYPVRWSTEISSKRGKLN